MDKIGLLGGSFDPIHFGHLNLAAEMMKIHGLDEVWFSPAYVNPHKFMQPPVAIFHRLEMVKRAISGNPSFRLFEWEGWQEGPSYTIDMLHFLEKQGDFSRQFFLIITEETAKDFLSWKDAQEILDKVTLLIGRRSAVSKPPQFPKQDRFSQAIEKGWTENRVLEISSTVIRDRLKRGLSCDHLVPEKVLDYIHSHKLYY